jgi:hypothetical protein
MTTNLADLMLAALLGGMLFFAVVVAPTVFQALPAKQAGVFLRRLFPRYYLYMIVTSGVAAALLWPNSHWPAKAMVLIAVSTLAIRQNLLPRLNRWRDEELGGKATSGKRFARWHRASVLINLAQLLTLLAVVWQRTYTAHRRHAGRRGTDDMQETA